MRGSWKPNRTAIYWPPTLMAISFSFPFSWAAQPGTWGPSFSGCWVSLPHLSPTRLIPNSQSGAWGLPLLGAGFFYRIFSPTDWISCALSYIIVLCPPSSCGRHNFALIQPVHGQGYNPDIPRPVAPVVYTGSFPILTARQGHRSIYNRNNYSLVSHTVTYMYIC